MKDLSIILALLLLGAASVSSQTSKTLSYNTTNGFIVYSGTSPLNFTNPIAFRSSSDVVTTRSNLGIAPTPTYTYDSARAVGNQIFGNIGNDQFTPVSSITGVIIGSSCVIIGERAFRAAAGVAGSGPITNLYLSEGVTIIANGAFQYNDLSTVTFPKSLTVVRSNSFGLNSLTNIVWANPNGVTNVQSFAFSQNKLISLNLPQGLQVIANNAFQQNAIRSITIPTTVTNIGTRAFFSNPLLTNVDCHVPKIVIDNSVSCFEDTGSGVLTINVRSNDATWDAGSNQTVALRTNATVIKSLTP